MPKQSLLRLIKRWRRYEPRGDWKYVAPVTRGIYVLYKQQDAHAVDGRKAKIFNVRLIRSVGQTKEE